MAPHPSHSGSQTEAEREMIASLSRKIKCPLHSAVLSVGKCCKVQVDGYNEQAHILCEVFARTEPLKPGQKRKLGNDILKLMLVERYLPGIWRKILGVASEEAETWLNGWAWQAEAVRAFGLQVYRVPLSPETASLVAKAQALQGREH